MSTEAERPLEDRTRRAVGFLGLTGGFTWLVGLARLAILARLLAPESFGVFALALVLVRAFEVVTGFGVDRYLIQKDRLDRELVTGAWALNLARGALVAGGTWAGAPLYAGLLGAGDHVAVFRIVALVPLLHGVVNPVRFLAERRLLFGRIAAYEAAGATFGALITVGLAVWLGDVRALAWGLVAAAGLGSALSYLVFPRPEPAALRWARVVELLDVGRTFVVLSVGSFLMTQGDNLLVGKVLGADSLGLYVLAYKLAEMPVQIYGRITNRVALPMFSRLQADPGRAAELLGRWADAQLLLLMPVAAAWVALPDLLVTGLYGARWAPAAPVLQALVVVTLGRGISHIFAPYILAVGEYGFSARVKGIEVAVFLVATWLGAVQGGMVGAALGAGLGYLVAAAARLGFVIRRGDLTGRAWGLSLVRNGGAAAVAGPAAAWGAGLLGEGTAPVLRLIVALAWLALWFLAVSWALRGRGMLEFVRILRGRPPTEDDEPVTASGGAAG